MANISSKKVRRIVYDKYKGRCAYCGAHLSGPFTIDHIIPKRRGDLTGNGPDTIANFNPSCYSCNSSKSTFSIEQWRVELEKKHSRLLRDSSSYRLLTRFGIIKQVKQKVTFYFESHG